MKISQVITCDEYANRIPNLQHMLKYTKAKEQCTQSKQLIS